MGNFRFVREHDVSRWHVARNDGKMMCGIAIPGAPYTAVRLSMEDVVCVQCNENAARYRHGTWPERPEEIQGGNLSAVLAKSREELISARVHLLRVRRLQTKAAENLENASKELDLAIERYKNAEEQFDNEVE